MKKLTVLTAIVLMACMQSFAGLAFNRTFYVPNDNCPWNKDLGMNMCYNGPPVNGGRYELHGINSYVGKWGKVKLTIESNEWGDGIYAKLRYHGNDGLNYDPETMYLDGYGLPWGGNGYADNIYEYWSNYGLAYSLYDLEIFSYVSEVSHTNIGGWVNVQVHAY